MKNFLKKKYLMIFSIIMVSILSITYAALNTDMYINGDAMVRMNYDIRITSIEMLAPATNAFETYKAEYSKESTTIHATLDDQTSEIIYEVNIRNNSTYDAKVVDIIEEINTNNNVKCELVDLAIDTKIDKQSDYKFKIKCTNNTNEEQQVDLKTNYKFEFIMEVPRNIQVTVAWLDDDASDRPNSIKVHLNKKGSLATFVSDDSGWTKNNDDTWTYTFNVVAFETDTFNVYIDKVTDYTSDALVALPKDVTNDAVTINNRYIPGIILVTKKWEGDTASDRPSNVIVHFQKKGSVLLPGGNNSSPSTSELEAKIKSIAGSGTANSNNTNVKAIKYATDAEYNAIKSTLTSSNEIQQSGEKTYMWFESSTGTIYFYSEADNIYLNTNSGGVFRKFTALEDISGLSHLNTSYVQDFNRLFQDSVKIKDFSPIADWNVSNVRIFRFAFGSNGPGTNPFFATSFEPFKNWDMGSVTDANQMFKGWKNVDDLEPLKNWDLSALQNAEQMFNYLGSSKTTVKNLDAIKDWDVTRVTTFSSMFNNMNINYSDLPVFTKRAGSWASSGGTYNPTITALSAKTYTSPGTPVANFDETTTASGWVKNSDNTWTYKYTVGKDNSKYLVFEEAVRNYNGDVVVSNPTVAYRGEEVIITNTKKDVIEQYLTPLEIRQGNSCFTSSIVGGMYRCQGTETLVFDTDGFPSSGTVGQYSVNNFICFGTDDESICKSNVDTYMYRIIGITSDNKIYVIKMTALNDSFQWNTSTPAPTWPNSSIYSAINGSAFASNTTYVPSSSWSNKIIYMNWYYGTGPNSLTNGNTYFNSHYSNWDISTYAQIGLQYPHDYLLAYPGGNPGSGTTAKAAWIHITHQQKGVVEWTMQAASNNTNNASALAFGSGNVYGVSVTDLNHIRPTFYIVSTIKASGNGTYDDPYVIVE